MKFKEKKQKEVSQVKAKKTPSKAQRYVKSLWTLVMLQLKDKIDFSFLKSTRKTIFKVIYSILWFAGLTAIIYLMFSLVVKFGLFSFLQTFNFRALLILMTVLFILSFFSCLFNVTRTLYFSKDNQVLMTMPASNGTIFSSKLIVCFIYELIKNVTYILPFFIAYGLVMKLSFFFFLWSILSLIFITVIIVALSGLLSIPAMGITILLKRNKILEFIVVGLVVGGITTAVVFTIGLLPTDLDLVRDWGKIYWSIQNFLARFAQIFFIFDYFLQLLTGMVYNGTAFSPFNTQNAITFGICVGIVLVSIGLIVVLSKPLFLKMVSTPFEYKKNEKKKPRKNRKFAALPSSTIQHMKRELRTPSIIYSIAIVALLTPIAIFLQNKIIAAMDTRILGNYMGIAFNILIILLMMLASNVILASVYSSEGNSAYLNKIVPVAFGIPLTGKLLTNAFICIVSIIVSTILINVFAHIGTVATILLSISLILVYIAHLYWSAELDIMNPQNRLYQTTGKQQKNPNEIKSTLIAFLTSAIFAFISFFLMSENINVVFVKLLLISLAFCAARIYLFYTRVNLYYKEK